MKFNAHTSLIDYQDQTKLKKSPVPVLVRFVHVQH